jgi:diadenosine tetraphosphate (Ap4A) HIT family hydrolase
MSKVDKSDLVQLLTKRENLSVEQATRIMDLIFDTISEESQINDNAIPDSHLKEVLRDTKDRPQDDLSFMCSIDECFDNECLFCTVSDEQYLIENDHAFAIADKYPITDGHTLIIPKRHFANYLDSIKVEHDAIYDLLKSRGKELVESDPQIEGFDIGVNVGEIAGQKVFHCHIHLIPRRKGDSPKWGKRSKSK